jgi:hypothetical protein
MCDVHVGPAAAVAAGRPLAGSAPVPMAVHGPPLVETRVRYFNEEYRHESGELTYSKASRHTITAPHNVRLHDGRALPNDGQQQLHERGFCLTSFHVPGLHENLDEFLLNPPGIRGDHEDKGPGPPLAEETRKGLYRAGAGLAKRVLGARYAFAMSHTCRRGNKGHTDGASYVTSYATFAHCDYTKRIVDADASWRTLVQFGVPEAEAKQMEVGYYNIWQPTNVPVQQNPLALVDWGTVDEDEDVRPVKLGHTSGYPRKSSKDGDSSQKDVYAPMITLLAPAPERHKWYYYPQLRPDEALIFSQVDGRSDRRTYTFHTAVVDPNGPPQEEAVPRHNYELRLLCAWPKGPRPAKL